MMRFIDFPLNIEGTDFESLESRVLQLRHRSFVYNFASFVQFQVFCKINSRCSANFALLMRNEFLMAGELIMRL